MPGAHGRMETAVPSACVRPQQPVGARAVRERAQGCRFCAEGQGHRRAPAAGTAYRSGVNKPSRHQESQEMAKAGKHPTQPLAMSAPRGCSSAWQDSTAHLFRRPHVAANTVWDALVTVPG